MHSLAQQSTQSSAQKEEPQPANEGRAGLRVTAKSDASARPESTLVSALVEQLAALGVEHAFGVSGGAIALFYDALVESSIKLHHFRHETGAAFAAAEAYFASGKPTVVFATTGPGTLNALTGITAAKWDGAKVILISGATSAPQRGRWATQETSPYTMPQDALYTRGPLFDFAVRMEQAAELPEVERRLSMGLSRSGGFVAHISLPMSLQGNLVQRTRQRSAASIAAPAVSVGDVSWCAELLQEREFVIWAGFGAREASSLVRQLAERSGAKVMCSPRGKGVFPENHPQYLGVTGLGGHSTVSEYMVQNKPNWVLVLGTRLGEATSFWDRDLEPASGFIHVDVDPEIPGTAYPDSETIGLQADISQFLTALLEHFPERHTIPLVENRRSPVPISIPFAGRGPVRPQVLMQSIQRRIVQTTDALVLSECGNAFAWCNHYLQFARPGRYRVSTLFGSMGHATAGVIGAALARQGKAVAIVGDGSMMMNGAEISTAVQYQAPAVWIILNDAAYGMCRDGHEALGLSAAEVHFPQVDFVGMARSFGADGIQVATEDMVDVALERALAAPGPFVVDVHIDPEQASPLRKRFESLIRQGGSKQSSGGWET